jgi:hypothetical protein
MLSIAPFYQPPSTASKFSTAVYRISDRSEVQAYLNGVKFSLKEKNPNKAVDSTATCVTPPAEPESRHGQP